VDVAQESTQLTKYNLLLQSGTAMLSQANQSPQAVLQLLKG
jgi:flagellin